MGTSNNNNNIDIVYKKCQTITWISSCQPDRAKINQKSIMCMNCISVITTCQFYQVIILVKYRLGSNLISYTCTVYNFKWWYTYYFLQIRKQ